MPGSILLVDDGSNVLSSIKAVLETEGYTVYTANNSDQARVIISENDVHLVIMDYILPDYSGDQRVKTLKKIDEKLNIIFLSGFPHVIKAVEDLEFDVYRVFLKPVDPEVLLSAMRNLFAENMDLQYLIHTDQILTE